MHSSMSVFQFIVLNVIKSLCVVNSPVQLLYPSPENPGSHIHRKLPMVSMQLAFSVQLCVSSRHSSISKIYHAKHSTAKL